MSKSYFINKTGECRKALAFPFPLAAQGPVTALRAARPWLWSGHQRQRAEAFYKSLHFAVFRLQEPVSKAHRSVNPSSTARGGSKTCTQRGNTKGKARPGKLNGEHWGCYGLGISRAAGAMLGNAPRCKSNLAGVEKELDYLNQHQRLYHNPPSKSYPKSILAFGKET